MKLYLSLIVLFIFPLSLPLCAQGPGKDKFQQPAAGDRFAPNNPMLAALESNRFTPEERERLKKLSKEDPAKFVAEMRKHFMEGRKKKAVELLQLRQNYMSAANPEAKKDALQKLRQAVRTDMDEHMKARQSWLKDMEKTVDEMEKRLNEMKKRYEKQLAEKDATLEKRVQELLESTPPKRLVRDAAGDFQQKDRKPRKGNVRPE